MTRPTCVTLGLLVLALAASPLAASAQDAQTPGPLIIQRIDNQWVAAPDFKVTDIDNATGTLAGGYAGWLMDRTILFGGAGYWLTNGSDSTKLGYGGALIEWMLLSRDAPIRFGVRALVGGGSATLGATLPEVEVVRFGGGRTPALPSLPRRVLVRDQFALAEPSATLRVHVLHNVGVTLGVGYRFTGATEILQDRLNGVTGSLAVQIGGW